MCVNGYEGAEEETEGEGCVENREKITGGRGDGESVDGCYF